MKMDNDQMQKKYQGIIDVDAEVSKRSQYVSDLGRQLSGLQDKYNNQSQKLNSKYLQSKQLYDELNQAISLLEETLDIQSYGLYKPHYDFSTSEEYKRELDRIYELQKHAIKEDQAAVCTTQWTVGTSKREGQKMINQNIRLILRAFNGECDSAIAKVSWNNITVMEARIRKACETINKFGTTLQIYITNEFLDLKLAELRLSYEYQEKSHQEKEEQRRIQEQIREEERAQRELEKAREDATKEEFRYQKALEKARAEMETAKGHEVGTLNAKIMELEKQLKNAQDVKQRAISQAQITKSGYVYIISNVGSFGDDVFKIGLTRRLEPMDRVKELGDASVPFQFDVHAMIYSENAPELERKLHEHFHQGQINLINDRKEFFTVKIDEVESYCLKHNLNCTFVKVPEAREYRESLAMRKQTQKLPIVETGKDTKNQFPDSLTNT